MRNFLYRCPNTKLMIQGTVEEPNPSAKYVLQQCPACNGLHLVNPQTGKTPSDDKSAGPSQRKL
jgi:hypothetical protein